MFNCSCCSGEKEITIDAGAASTAEYSHPNGTGEEGYQYGEDGAWGNGEDGYWWDEATGDWVYYGDDQEWEVPEVTNKEQVHDLDGGNKTGTSGDAGAGPQGNKACQKPDTGDKNPVATSSGGAAGKGRLVFPDGSAYDGEFHGDQQHGFGKYTFSNGSIYEGQWVDGMQEGNGTEKLADGSSFQGEFKKGDKNGFGKFKWATGGHFEGEFETNDMHGQGMYEWSDGRTYKGQWRRNTMGPKGVMTWTDGRRYEGDFKDGKKHGDGELKWPDGRSYTGQWAIGTQHGTGLAITAKGLARRSEWANGSFIKWLEAAPSDGQKAAACPKGHALKVFNPPTDGYSCSSCKKKFTKDHLFMSCRTCDYDLCEECCASKEELHNILVSAAAKLAPARA